MFIYRRGLIIVHLLYIVAKYNNFQKLNGMYPGEFFTFMLGPAGDASPHFAREKRDYAEIARSVSEYCSS